MSILAIAVFFLCAVASTQSELILLDYCADARRIDCRFPYSHAVPLEQFGAANAHTPVAPGYGCVSTDGERFYCGLDAAVTPPAKVGEYSSQYTSMGNIFYFYSIDSTA